MGFRMTRAVVTALLIASAAAWPAGIEAQEPTDSLRTELERLRARVDSLSAVVANLRAAGADTTEAASDLEALRAAAAAAAGGAEPDTAAATEPGRFVGRQRNQQALNPEITVTGDVFGFLDLDDPDRDNVVPREFEVSFQSALDPYSLAKVFIGYHLPGGELTPFGEAHGEEPQLDEGHAGEDPDADHDADEEDAHGHGGELAVEEGYIQWRGLPGGLNVQAGLFRQNFGSLNRWHPHALPGQSYPLPYVAFFGEEGLAQPGVGVHWLAPVRGFGTWELWTEITSSSNERLFGEARSPSVLGRVNAFWDLTPATYFEVGATGMAGPSMDGEDTFGTRLAGADATLSWRPPGRGRYREATLRTGVVYGKLRPEPAADPAADVLASPGPAWGGFANAEYRLDQRWILGGRIEYTENPMEPDETAWLAAPTLTWWQSEWVRLRLEFDWLDRPEGALKLLVFQATFAMGPHKHETY